MKKCNTKLNRLNPPARFVGVFIFAVLLAVTAVFEASAEPPDAGFYEYLERFHGHTCAGSIFGARLGAAAKANLGSDGKLKATYFDLSCPVDGIQASAGTTFGNKDLEVIDRDEHLLVLTDENSGRQMEARLTDEAKEMGKRFRELSSKARKLPAESEEYQQCKEDIATVLEWLKTAPDSAVVALTTK